jgi:hypothetical protein
VVRRAYRYVVRRAYYAPTIWRDWMIEIYGLRAAVDAWPGNEIAVAELWIDNRLIRAVSYSPGHGLMHVFRPDERPVVYWGEWAWTRPRSVDILFRS